MTHLIMVFLGLAIITPLLTSYLVLRAGKAALAKQADSALARYGDIVARFMALADSGKAQKRLLEASSDSIEEQKLQLEGLSNSIEEQNMQLEELRNSDEEQKMQLKELNKSNEEQKLHLEELNNSDEAQKMQLEGLSNSIEAQKMQLDTMNHLLHEVIEARKNLPEQEPLQELTPEEQREQERNQRLGKDIQSMLGYNPYDLAKKRGK